MMFNEKKAAHSVAYFCIKNDGKPISVLKVVKLIYISDRESLRTRGHPIQSDKYVSMPHGPVNSMLLNYINGMYEDIDNKWSEIISERTNHKVGLKKKDISIKDLSSLSRADRMVMDSIWEKFKDMDQFKIRDWTHNKENIPEWTDPNGGAINIKLEEICKSVGLKDYTEIAKDIRELQNEREFLTNNSGNSFKMSDMTV